jgi:ribosomal protein S18 acetylase RimI-like enzyme
VAGGDAGACGVSALSYRAYREADFPVLKEMYVKLDEYLRGLTVKLPLPDDVGQVWLDSFERTLGKFSMLHIAELDGNLVGFMLSRVLRVPPHYGGVLVGELTDMYIDPQARRMGIGHELSRLAINWLRDQGVHSVEIQIVDGNEGSWRLYEKMGFYLELRQVRMLIEDYQDPGPPAD